MLKEAYKVCVHRLITTLEHVLLKFHYLIYFDFGIFQRDAPIIFLPTHRSHLDYILITFILFNFDMKAPHVAAGDNLMIPIFG